MKIAVFGVRGMIGSRVAAEASRRGQALTAVMRDVAQAPEGIQAVTGDVLDPAQVARAVRGMDAVVSAFGPGREPASRIPEAARALVSGLREAGLKRLVVVGGAGSLQVKPGLRLVDTPDFPAAWKPMALAHAEALEILRAATDLEWTYVSPSHFIEPGRRTGRYRVGFEDLLHNAKGESRISAEDYAIAVLDEVEHPRHVRERITVIEADPE